LRLAPSDPSHACNFSAGFRQRRDKPVFNRERDTDKNDRDGLGFSSCSHRFCRPSRHDHIDSLLNKLSRKVVQTLVFSFRD
jgi:hypothetical protein